MTTLTRTRSAYPTPVDELIPQVSDWASELGRLPSRNQIMNRFRVGTKKASTVLAQLAEPPVASEPVPAPTETGATASPETNAQVKPLVDPDPTGDETPAPAAGPAKLSPVRPWPVFLLALPAFVAIWGGWVGLGEMTGFGPIHLLPGIADGFVVNSAITLPIGVETYAAFALRVSLSASNSERTRKFAARSVIGALALGMAGQIAYHQMEAAGVVVAPWIVTTIVSCLPVGVLGCGSALAHLLITDYRAAREGRR